MTEIDWSSLQKEAATAGVLPDGPYNVIVTEANAVTSSTGKPMIKVKMRVTDGPHKDKPVYGQFVISAESPIALRIFFQQMAAFGLDANFFAGNPGMEIVAKNLTNRGVTVELGHREWNGSDRNEIKNISPLQAGGPITPGVVTGPPSASPQTPSGPPAPVAPSATPAAASSAPAGDGATPPPPKPF